MTPIAPLTFVTLWIQDSSFSENQYMGASGEFQDTLSWSEMMRVSDLEHLRYESKSENTDSSFGGRWTVA
jgi:hypothetical protein